MDAYLVHGDSDALVRAGRWVVDHYALAGCQPDLHLALVQWFLDRGHLDPVAALHRVAIQASAGGTLTMQAVDIALIAREMIDEGLLGDGIGIVLPMLREYVLSTPVTGHGRRSSR
ncbi:hypothetical protein [Stenotrophomonas sp. GZD-301]|uniref:hypothetical protein n=1 Tax=Stenotrophomonas sp. GZD-301 TaxID=3404814 RepID=UPI003BB682EC